jgi:hypothetical protein
MYGRGTQSEGRGIDLSSVQLAYRGEAQEKDG